MVAFTSDLHEIRVREAHVRAQLREVRAQDRILAGIHRWRLRRP